MNTIPASKLPYAPRGYWTAVMPETSGGKWRVEMESGPMLPWKKVATVHGKGDDGKRRAALISRAPELLECLERSIRIINILQSGDVKPEMKAEIGKNLERFKWLTKYARETST